MPIPKPSSVGEYTGEQAAARTVPWLEDAA